MDNTNNIETVISAEVSVTGTIKTSGTIQFNGKLEGDLHSDGDTTVGKTATVKGNLQVNSVTIAGTINGNITAQDRIQMLSTARVNGDIKSKRLTVEDGVTFVGRSEVNPTGQASAPAPAEAKAESGNEKGPLFNKK